MANIKISQLNQYDGSDYSNVDVAGVDRQEGVNVKVNLAPVNEIKNKVSDNTFAQGLTAGFAQMLLGNETPTEQTFTTQQTGGGSAYDGVTTYVEVRGNSQVVDGVIINNTTEAIKTKDSDGNVIGKISVKPHYIEGGLKSAGNVYDSKFADKEVQRIGVVDLGSLNWSSNGFGAYYASVNGIKKTTPYIYNILAIGYTLDYRCVTSTTSAPDMTMANGNNDGNFFIKDARFTSSAKAKEILQGQYLLYELATPIVHTYEQAENTSALIKANGTEEAIASTPSTPVKVMARYSIDVYQAVKDLLAASQAEPQAE